MFLTAFVNSVLMELRRECDMKDRELISKKKTYIAADDEWRNYDIQ